MLDILENLSKIGLGHFRGDPCLAEKSSLHLSMLRQHQGWV